MRGRGRGRGIGVAGVVAAGWVLAACGPAVPAPSPAPSPDVTGTSGEAHVTAPLVTAAPVTTSVDLVWPDLHAVEGEPVITGFRSSVAPVDAARLTSSWRPGCPVPVSDLRSVTVTHWTFEGTEATGELVLHAEVADSAVAVFAALYDQGFPIRSMRLVDEFGGSDDASMAADNTSAFNCRPVAGGTGWSEHAYGRAVDLNPRENPYLRGTVVLPPEGAPYADRPQEPGVVQDAQVAAFAAQGWRWGGAWSSPVDLQHFSTTGR
ncbi:M15 family metallopeptidase [Cellulomonas sp. RIT-PI-Y]|uniref:M15 family metallopeptidase n=1 Tax=Cellulomonas sp. RIT-PI-Y TaxID=3035297 RepID=UPI0021D8A572|nr:M15 family metallopeptidase [Cellulomonas sp. RIT-PI-Y]